MKKIIAFLAVAMTAQVFSPPASAYEALPGCGDRNQYIFEGHPQTEERGRFDVPRFDVDEAYIDGYVRAGMLGCERMYRRCFKNNRNEANRDPLKTGIKANKQAADHDLQNTIIPNFNACRAFYRNYRKLRSQQH